MAISEVSSTSTHFDEYPPEIRDILLASGLTPSALSSLPQFKSVLKGLVEKWPKLPTDTAPCYEVEREWYYRGAALIRIVERVCCLGKGKKGDGDYADYADYADVRRKIGVWLGRQMARERLLPDLGIVDSDDNVIDLTESERKWFAKRVQKVAEDILGSVEWMWTSSVPSEVGGDADSGDLAGSIRRVIKFLNEENTRKLDRAREESRKMWSAFELNSLALGKLSDLAIQSSKDIEGDPEISRIMEALAKSRAMRAKMKLLEAQLGADTYTPKVVKGLDATQRQLHDETSQLHRRIRKVKSALQKYNQDAMGFTKVVEEYKIAKKELEEKQWTIKTLGLQED